MVGERQILFEGNISQWRQKADGWIGEVESWAEVRTVPPFTAMVFSCQGGTYFELVKEKCYKYSWINTL